MASIAEANSLFEIDIELDGLLEQIEEQIEFEGQASEELMNRFQQFCEAHGEKVDRQLRPDDGSPRTILPQRGCEAYRKIEARIDGVHWETVLSYLPDQLAKTLELSIKETSPDADAIKAAVMRNQEVPGAEVRRGSHLRVA